MRRALVLASCALIAAAAFGADPPPLTVFPNPLTFSGVSTPHFRAPLTITNASSAPVDVTVEATALQSPLGDSIPLQISKPVALKPGEKQIVTLSAELPNVTSYSAQVKIAGLDAMKLDITRTPTTVPISLSEVTIGKVESTIPRQPLHIPVEVDVYASGSDVTVDAPFLDSVTRRATLSANAVPMLASEVKLTGLPSAIDVKSGQKRVLNFAVDGIELPGKYDARIRFAPSGFQPLDKTFTIYVRDPFWVPMLWIFLGVCASFVLFIYGGTIRPRLLAQQRVTTLFLALRDDETRAAGDRQAEALVRKVRDNIKRQWDYNQQQRIASMAELDAYERIVEGLAAWIAYRKQVATLRPATVRKPLNAKLDDIAAQLGADHPQLMDVQMAIASLRGMRGEIRKAISDELKRQLDDLKLQLQDIPPGTKIRELVVAAASQLEHDDVESAVDSLQGARLEYAHYVAGQLLDRVSNDATPAKGMTAKEWASVKLSTRSAAEKAQASADPDEAMEWLVAAADPYVREVAAALQAAAMEKIADAMDKQSVLNAADAAVSTLAQSVAGAINRLDAAALLYDKALAKTTTPPAVHAAVASSVFSSVLAGLGAAPGGTTFDMSGVGGFGGPAGDLDRIGALESTRRQLTTFDVAVSIAVVVIGCLIGTQTLWVDNPVWGGPTSYLAAFVLGFGLDQFSKAGISAFRR